MKKFLKSIVLIFLVLPATFLFSACGKPTVVDIQKTNTTDSMVVYTIYYSNGTTSSITIENGKDGESIDVEALYQLGVTKGYYTDDLTGYQQFLTDLMNKNTTSVPTQAGVSKALQSAVSVYAKFPVSSYSYNTTEVSCGAGVIYKMDAEYSYIITNYHVLYNANSTNSSKLAQEVYIYQYGVDELITANNNDYVFGGDAVKCEYIGGSMNYDIGILKAKTADLTSHNINARAVDIATNYSISQTVYTIGNPEAEGISVTKGIVSVYSEEIETAIGNNTIQFRVLRMDSAINGGNSGGGVFNENGELIGIANAKLVYDNDQTPVEGMSYAIPFDNVTKVVENIMYYYNIQNQFSSVLKIQLGITYQVSNSKQVYDALTGEVAIEDEIELVEDPKVNTIAYSMGLKKGDIITAFTINDKTYKLKRAYYLGDLLLNVRTGDEIVVSYKRDGVSYVSGAHEVMSTELIEIK